MEDKDYLKQIGEFEDAIIYGHELLEEDNALGAAINLGFAQKAYSNIKTSGRRIDESMFLREIVCLDKMIQSENGGRSDIFSFMGF